MWLSKTPVVGVRVLAGNVLLGLNGTIPDDSVADTMVGADTIAESGFGLGATFVVAAVLGLHHVGPSFGRSMLYNRPPIW
jgi:hypothetical protein